MDLQYTSKTTFLNKCIQLEGPYEKNYPKKRIPLGYQVSGPSMLVLSIPKIRSVANVLKIHL